MTRLYSSRGHVLPDRERLARSCCMSAQDARGPGEHERISGNGPAASVGNADTRKFVSPRPPLPKEWASDSLRPRRRHAGDGSTVRKSDNPKIEKSGSRILGNSTHRRPERSEAQSRDLFSATSRVIVEERSLHSALRAPVGTTGASRKLENLPFPRGRPAPADTPGDRKRWYAESQSRYFPVFLTGGLNGNTRCRGSVVR
jgi:hypothetical protein